MVSKCRRQLLKQSIVLASSASLAGCTGDKGGGGQKGKKQSNWVYNKVEQKSAKNIVAFNLDSMEGDPAIQAHFKAFEKQTDVKVKPKAVPQSNALSKARTLLQSKSNTPDIYDLVDSVALSLGKKGYFEKVDHHITTADVWAPAAKEVCTWPDGVTGLDDYPYPNGLYMTPHYANGWFTFINEDTLEKARINRSTTPKTFSEVLELCNKLTDVVENPMLFPMNNVDNVVSLFYNLVQRAGGHLYKGSKPDFENDGFVKATNFVLTCFKKGYIPQAVTSMGEGEVTTQFFDGGGLMFNPLANLFLDTEQLPINKPAHKVGRIALFPKPDGAGDTPTGDMAFVGYVLSIFSKHKKAGAKYMNLVTEKEEQAKELTIEGNLPIRPDVFDMKKVQDEVPYTDVMKKHLAGFGHFSYPNASRVDEAVYSRLTSAVANGWSAQETAKKIQQDAKSF